MAADPTTEYKTLSPLEKLWLFILIVDTVVPTPIAVDANETELITIVSIVELYLAITFSVLSGTIFKVITDEVEMPWEISVVIFASNFSKVPVTFGFNVLILWFSPPVVPIPILFPVPTKYKVLNDPIPIRVVLIPILSFASESLVTRIVWPFTNLNGLLKLSYSDTLIPIPEFVEYVNGSKVWNGIDSQPQLKHEISIFFGLINLFFLKNTAAVRPTPGTDVLLNSIFAKVDPTDMTLASVVLIPAGVPLIIWTRSAGENEWELKNSLVIDPVWIPIVVLDTPYPTKYLVPWVPNPIELFGLKYVVLLSLTDRLRPVLSETL